MKCFFLSELFVGEVKDWIMYAIALVVIVACGIVVYRKKQQDNKNKTSSGSAETPVFANMSLGVGILIYTVLMVMLSSVLTYQLSHEKNFMVALSQDWWKGVGALLPLWAMSIIRIVKTKTGK